MLGVVCTNLPEFTRLMGGTITVWLEEDEDLDIHLPKFSANNTLTAVKPVTRNRQSAPSIMSAIALKFILKAMAER